MRTRPRGEYEVDARGLGLESVDMCTVALKGYKDISKFDTLSWAQLTRMSRHRMLLRAPTMHKRASCSNGRPSFRPSTVRPASYRRLRRRAIKNSATMAPRSKETTSMGGKVLLMDRPAPPPPPGADGLLFPPELLLF